MSVPKNKSVFQKLKDALIVDEAEAEQQPADPAAYTQPVYTQPGYTPYAQPADTQPAYAQPDPAYTAPPSTQYTQPVPQQTPVYYPPPAQPLPPTPPSPPIAATPSPTVPQWTPPPAPVSPPIAAAPASVLAAAPASPPYTPPSPRPAPASGPVAPTLPPNVNLDAINTIYQEQGVAQASYAAEQALRFLSAFPDEQVDANRRAALIGLVESLGPTLPGLSLESLGDDAANKIAVLEQASRARTEKFKKFEADTEAEIASLREQIQQRRTQVEARRVQDQQLALACMEHAERLRRLKSLLS
jgi:hypothetical protein